VKQVYDWVLRRSYLIILALIVVFIVVFARTHRVADAIKRDYAASGNKTIDLPKSVPQPWQRVCVLGPYSTANAARASLGFDWNADAHSNVRDRDTVVLLIFVTRNIVVASTDYPRVDGDLSRLTGKCYPRSEARFTPVL
jgi:hypothetical protein